MDIASRIGPDFLATDFSLGGGGEDGAPVTRFRIQKLLPMEAYYVLEEFRVGLGPSLAKLDLKGDESESDLSALAGVVGAIPHHTLESIRKRIFAQIFFTNNLAPKARPVHPDEGMAFRGLQPMAIYEVLIRGFAVNFIESFQGLESLFPAETPDSK